MKHAKRCSLILTALIVLTLIAGCGQEVTRAQSDAPGANTDNTTPISQPSDDGTLKLTDKEMTITLWDIATDEPANIIQPAAVERFMTAYPNIKVENIESFVIVNLYFFFIECQCVAIFNFF